MISTAFRYSVRTEKNWCSAPTATPPRRARRTCSLQIGWSEGSVCRVALKKVFEIGSPFCILAYENGLNPNLDRRAAAILLSQKASRQIEPNEKIRERAKQFEKINIKSRDALHLACAEFAGCGYFLTCDDKFLKKGRQFGLKVKVMNPVEFVNLMERQNGH